MAGETLSEDTAATPWGTTGSQDDKVKQFKKLEFFEIVESSLVDHLPQEFDGRLGPKLFYLGRVEVINKDDHRLEERRAQFAFFPLDKLFLVVEEV